MRTVLLVILFMLSACTDPPTAERALDDMGMKNIHVGGYSWFGCGQDDWYATKFTAINQNGKYVAGVVCNGIWFKNSTVRFE